jgi:hypothetical protein
MLVRLGRYCRMRPLVFSFVPRSQAWCGIASACHRARGDSYFSCWIRARAGQIPPRNLCMNSTSAIGLVGAWFLFGMARMVFTSKMVEHRIDHPDPSRAMAFTFAAAKERVNVANYDPRGQRLLPWYRVVTTTYWMLAGGMCGWAVLVD